jgi:hypothetical protein
MKTQLEYRTEFDMETDTGERYDMLEQKANEAFNDIFMLDDDPFETTNVLNRVRWSWSEE